MDLGFDIAQSPSGNLVQSANGDLSIFEKNAAIMQDIKNEAITYSGDLFYNEEYGWGLYDFMHREIDLTDDLLKTEIQHRISTNLAKREYIDMSSLSIDIFFNEFGTFEIQISFRFEDEDEPRQMKVNLDRVGIEVVLL